MQDAGNLTMSAKELDRLEIISRVAERRLTQRKAAERLGLSLRQVERLWRAFRADGAAGLVSGKRGRPSNRKLAAALGERALNLVRGRYADFLPTLACEKLAEHPPGLSAQERTAELERIDSEILELESAEEGLIRRIEGHGLEIDRRADASPAVVLSDLGEDVAA